MDKEDLPLMTRFHSVLHLLNSTMFLNVLVVGFLSIPMLYIKNEWGHLAWFFKVSSTFHCEYNDFLLLLLGIVPPSIRQRDRTIFEYTRTFFTFYTVAMGFSFHNALAVFGRSSRKTK